MDKRSKEKFITEHSPGVWRVWVAFGAIDNGQRYFSETQYGSKEKALAEAIKYRDSIVRIMGIPVRNYDGNGYYLSQKHGQKGRLLGVQLMKKVNNGNIVGASWIARGMVAGKQKIIRRFSVFRNGYYTAFELASAVRVESIDINSEMIEIRVPEPPQWFVDLVKAKGWKDERIWR